MNEKELMNAFMEEYEKATQHAELYMKLGKIDSGIPRWRLHVFAKDAAKTGAGDMELICIEKPTKAECLLMGIRRMS